MKEALIIFVRHPELGRVKTRLAAQVGAEKALEIYKKLLSHTRQIALKVNCQRYLFVTGSEKPFNWDGFHEAQQPAGDLGQRMQHAFRMLFQMQYDKVVIIGSDCPGLDEGLINEAFQSLMHHDAVIGPALDGGYYLLGMKKIIPAVFENKAWSTATVYADTMKDLLAADLSCNQLKTLRDVDEADDLPEGWAI